MPKGLRHGSTAPDSLNSRHRLSLKGMGRCTHVNCQAGTAQFEPCLSGGSLGLAVVAAAAGHVFVPGWAGGATGPGDALYMLDTRTGTLLRTITIPFDPLAIGEDGPGKRIFVVSAGGMKGNSASFLGTGVVSMLDARSGMISTRIRGERWPDGSDRIGSRQCERG